jgi:hypothetical protein
MPYYEKWYQDHKEEIRARHDRSRDEKRKFIAEQKLQGCASCPETDPRCLDFHHRDPATKDFAVANAVGLGVGWKRLKEEIAKCEVICSNCHRKLIY